MLVLRDEWSWRFVSHNPSIFIDTKLPCFISSIYTSADTYFSSVSPHLPLHIWTTPATLHLRFLSYSTESLDISANYNNFGQIFNNKMLPQPQSFSSQPQTQPRVLHFLSRTNGTLVPLIPADELPFNVRLQGVPRVLTLDQTLGMQHVALAPYTGLTFKLEHEVAMHRSTSQPQTPTHSRSHSNSETTHFLPPDELARQAITNSKQSNGKQPTPQRPLSAHELATNWRKPPTSEPKDDTQAIINAIVSSGAGAETAARIGYPPKGSAVPPSGNVPDQDRKEFCTYWIRTGECDYTQQGCLYKHEMPDKETLRKIGFRDYPAWWTKKTQTIRMGGEKASVGPIISPSVWLNGRKGSRSDSNRSSNSSSASVKSEDDEPKTKVTIAAEPEANQSRSTTTITATPSLIKARKQSHPCDLIDFTPLLPTPSITPSSTTPNSTVESPPCNISTPRTLGDTEVSQGHSVEVRAPFKIFVPAGESSEVHIAEARKRGARRQANEGRQIASADEQRLDKQIQLLQKSKHQGMMASKHAPATAVENGNVEQLASPSKRVSKSGCRVRRPASFTTTSTPRFDGAQK